MVNAFDSESVIQHVIQLSVQCTERGWLIPIPTESELELLDTLSLMDELLRVYHLSRFNP
jgi:hypothetical protein